MYQTILRPILFQLDPEKAHHLAINSCQMAQYIPGMKKLLSMLFMHQNPVEVMGLKFPNRIGLAAGLDKNAQVADIFTALGFGFVEVGTITPLGQPGNPKPRLFRIPKDNALINRMGFNNKGLDAAKSKLEKYAKRNFILGGNIGKNTLTDNSLAINDYKLVIEGIYNLVDYVVLNVSCPNIANLSQLQNQEYLGAIMDMMYDYRKHTEYHKPLILKISPDLQPQNIQQIIELMQQYKFDGIIVSNTTTSRKGLSLAQSDIEAMGNGGLSGKPLFKDNLSLVREIRMKLPSEVSVIACGGIFSVDDARQMFDTGANLLQIYTSFIYKGPSIVKELARLHM